MSIFSQQAINDLKKSVETGKAIRGPIDVQIMPLDFCNLNCGFCPVQAVTDAIKEKYAPRFKTGRLRMEWRLFEKIIEGLKELGHVERVHLTGGEPLLHPELTKMVSSLKHDLGAEHVAVVTNGIALKGRAAALIEAGLDRLSVSINSVVPKTRLMLSSGEPPDYYNKIIDGLREFGALRRQNVPGFALSSVLTHLNYHEVRQQFDFAKEIGADSVTFLPLMGFEYGGVVGTRNLMVNPKQFSAFLKDLDKIQEDAQRAGIWVGYSGRGDDNGRLVAPDTALRPCYSGFTFAMFWPNGSVRPCCNCDESMGNLFRQSLSEIWYGEKYSHFRGELLRPDIAKKGCSCAECGYQYENSEYYQRILSND